MPRSLRKGGMAGALALLLLATVPADAQELGSMALAVDAPVGPVKPAIENPPVVATVTLSCELVLANSDPSDVDAHAIVGLRFDTGETGIVVSGPDYVQVPREPCLAGAFTATGAQTLQISIPRTTPGLSENTLHAEATLTPNHPGMPPVEAAAEFGVTADAYLVSQVKLETKLRHCEDGHADYAMEIANFGNVPTRYTFALATEPGGGWRGHLPDPVVVQVEGTSTVAFAVDCPGGNKEGAFGIVIQPAADADPGKQGNALQANVLARARFVEAPAPPVGWAGLLLLALATARRLA